METAYFGVAVSVLAADGDAYLAAVDRRFVRIDANGTTPCELPAKRAPVYAPFTFEDFGATWRLAWPGGGCSVKTEPGVVVWGGRYAAAVERRSLTLVDAETSRHARIEFGEKWLGQLRGVVATTTHLAIGSTGAVVLFELAALVEVLTSEARDVTMQLLKTYPLRDRGAAIETRSVSMMAGGSVVLLVPSKIHLGGVQKHIPSLVGVERPMTIVLRDHLWGDEYAIAEVPGRPPQTIVEVGGRTPYTMRIVRGKTRDPADGSKPVAANDPRLEELLLQLASEPDNDATRLVFVDLLQQLGESYGTWLAHDGDAKVRGRKRDALGPLAHYLDNLQYRHGLPWSATLARKPPKEPEHVAAACEDLRLGLLSSFWLGKGPRDIYGKLVSSPRAIGLRRVEVPYVDIANALVAGERTRLTHLHEVRISDDKLVARLADPTFDTATEVWTSVQSVHGESFVRRIRDDKHRFFARVPRTLVVRERHGHDSLLFPVLFAAYRALPIGTLRIGAIELRRDNTATIGSTGLPLSYWLDPLAEALPDLAQVEVVDEHDLAAAQAGMPHVTVVRKA